MKTNHRIVEIVTIIAVTTFIVFAVRSCGEPPLSAYQDRPTYNDGFKEGLDVGKLPTHVLPDVEEMVYDLCAEKGIDSNQAFTAFCPKCHHATCLREKDDAGVAIFGFLAKRNYTKDTTIMDLHCGGCEHIFSSDWIVAGVKVVSINILEGNEGVVFENITFVEPNEPEDVNEYLLSKGLTQQRYNNMTPYGRYLIDNLPYGVKVNRIDGEAHYQRALRKEREAYLLLWPEVVVNPDYKYTGDNIYERAMADGLSAWGVCMAGNNPPKNFGWAMIKIGKEVGVLATPKNLMEVSKHFEGKQE